MNLKKRFIFIMIAFMLCIAIFAACEENAEGKVNISLSSETQQIEVYREYLLKAEVSNTAEAVVWSSSDEKIAVVDNGLVRGISEGTAIITAKAGDASATCTVIVVKANSVPELIVNQSNISLEEDAQITINASVSYKGVEVTADKISWSNADESIVKIEADGMYGAQAVITGMHYGKTQITLSTTYIDRELTKTIAVNVTRPTTDMTQSQDKLFLETTSSLELSIPEEIAADGAVEALYFDGIDVLGAYDADSGVAALKSAAMEDIAFGNKSIVVYTDKKAYILEVVYCTMAIKTAEELNTLADVVKDAPDGYYVLADNIDYRTQVKPYEYVNTHFKTITEEFNGVFDGQGHYIRGMTIKGYDCGFFRKLGVNGVIKNVSFFEAQLGGNGSWAELVDEDGMDMNTAQDKDTGADKGGFVVQINEGLVTNIFVSGKIVSDGVPWLSNGGINTLLVSYGGRVEQCIVECLAGPARENTNAEGKVVRRWGSYSIFDHKQQIKEVFGLGGRVMINTVTNDSWTEQEWDQWNTTYSYSLLSQSADQLQSESGVWIHFKDSIAAWDISIWNIETKIPLFKSHYGVLSDDERAAYLD